MVLMFDPYAHVASEPTALPAEVGACPTLGRLMFLLMARSIDTWLDDEGGEHPKLTVQERGMQCYAWAAAIAETDVYLAEQLREIARQYAAQLYQPEGD